MASGDLSEAKRKELETRKRLGPRKPRSPSSTRVTAPERRQRATGAPTWVLGHDRGTGQA